MSAPTQAAARFRKSGKRYLLDGAPVPSVTTIIREGFPAPNLIGWAMRETAGYAVDNWSELDGLPLSERLRRLERAAYERRDKAALDGTRVHEYGDAVSHGRAVEVPEAYRDQVAAYARWLDAWRFDVMLTERPVVHTGHGWAGTFDLLARDPDGLVWLLDIKTGKDVYESHALQLAAYAHAEFWLDEDDTLQPWIRPDKVGAVHVRADGCELRPVDAGDRTYQVFRHAAVVAAWARQATEAYKDRRPWPIGLALDPPAA